VSEADIGKVQTGQKVNFNVTAFPSRTFTGTVAAIEPAGTTTSNVVSYTVRITVDPTDVQLLPGMTATVTIVTQAADNTILVPNAALTYANTAASGAKVVDVLRSGSVTPVEVQTGITDGVNTQIVSGLQAGDQVVTAVSSGSTGKSSSASGSSSILGLGGAGGGGNANANRTSSSTSTQKAG
jgi:HlyD family secretion protein